MAAFNVDFVRGIAMVLKGECLKAKAFVTHSGSIGTLRERMVRRFVIDETPDRFRVETGLIRGAASTSRQCDLLIYDAEHRAPLYRWEDFVVITSANAKAVIEVKTMLNQQGFNELTDVQTSVVSVQGGGFIPTFGYALEGVTFDTFVGYVATVVTQNPLGNVIQGLPLHLNWPVCIAVQNRRYLGFRHLGGRTANPFCFCAIDLSQSTNSSLDLDIDGIETGYFLQIYDLVLHDPCNSMWSDILFTWFNQLPVADSGKVWITTDGQIHRGNISAQQSQQPAETSSSEPLTSSAPE